MLIAECYVLRLWLDLPWKAQAVARFPRAPEHLYRIGQSGNRISISLKSHLLPVICTVAVHYPAASLDPALAVEIAQRSSASPVLQPAPAVRLSPYRVVPCEDRGVSSLHS